MRSAERRAYDIWLELSQRAFGSIEEWDAYEREIDRERDDDAIARKAPPPEPGARRKLIPNWARRKWLGGR